MSQDSIVNQELMNDGEAGVTREDSVLDLPALSAFVPHLVQFRHLAQVQDLARAVLGGQDSDIPPAYDDVYVPAPARPRYVFLHICAYSSSFLNGSPAFDPKHRAVRHYEPSRHEPVPVSDPCGSPSDTVGDGCSEAPVRTGESAIALHSEQHSDRNRTVGVSGFRFLHALVRNNDGHRQL